MNNMLLKTMINFNCNNEILHKINDYEISNKLTFSDEYKFIMDKCCFHENFEIDFMVEIPFLYKKNHYFKFTNFYNFKELNSDFEIFKDNEIECIKWFEGFKSYNCEGFIPILSMIGNSDFRELFLNCSKNDNGSLYLVDRGIIYGLDEMGCPIKVRIADSISHLLEIAQSQKGKIPEEYL